MQRNEIGPRCSLYARRLIAVRLGLVHEQHSHLTVVRSRQRGSCCKRLQCHRNAQQALSWLLNVQLL